MANLGLSSFTSYLFIVLSCLFGLVSILLLKRSNATYSKFRRIGKRRPPGLFSFTSRATAATDFAANGPRQVRDAYLTDKTVPVYISSVNRLVLPPGTLQELSRLPADVANLRENFVDRYAGRWTGFDVILETSLFSDVVRVGLTQNLDALLPHLRNELQRGLADRLQPSNGPISVPIFDLVLDMTLRMTAFALVGTPICHNPAFLAILKAYPTTVDTVSKQFNNYSPLVHPLLALVSKPLAQLRRMQAQMETILTPAVREATSKIERDNLDIASEKTKHIVETQPFNMLRALAQRSSGSMASPRKIGSQLMFLSLAALFVSAVSTTQVVLQMVARPSWVRQLREEMELLCNEKDKKTDGLVPYLEDGDVKQVKMSVGDLKKLHKLDAFIKETVRMDMPGWSSVMRKSMQSFTLNSPSQPSSNTDEKIHPEPIVVPAQTMVCIPTAAMSRDPEYFFDPDTFNPSRFYATSPNTSSSVESKGEAEVTVGQAGMGKEEGQEVCNTLPDSCFVDLDPCMPIWGLGRWSCPGRFYADLQIKLIVTEILMKWDVSLSKCRDTGHDDGIRADFVDEMREIRRMKRINTGDRIIPDPKQEVVFTRRVLG